MFRFLTIAFTLASSYASLEDLKPLAKENLLQMMYDSEKLKYTEDIVRDIYKSVVEEAMNGKGEFSIEFTGCDNSNIKISKELCVEIVTDVFGIVQAKFPDSLVAYNVETKEFKVSWAK